ncbi:hypothetical protein [Mesonia sp.]|uniref:hypothetical protein n=1 Tax=Mesonia sp. TaxID=1960830 RepID=UPI00175BA99D|nr:hypothetical protein [Mesonia sp.]HIB37024.1 hypothetical protein [Mesonia sp.]HIO27399.1 hypothetical protein [Flavobacteriaceae bacterium]
MKKYILGICALAGLISCEVENNFDNNNLKENVELNYFTDKDTIRTVAIGINDDSTVNVQVGSTQKKNNSRTFSITLDNDLTSLEQGSDFTIPQSATIEAGEFVTDLPVDLVFEELTTEKDTIAFSISGDNVTDTRSNYMLIVSKSCPSDLTGTYSYTSTNLIQGGSGASCGAASGEVTWTELEEGIYETSDASFGQFGSCWGDGPATGIQFTHNCDQIIVDSSSSDQYGDSYFYEIVSVEGTEMVINWNNTYGDSGTATITNPDGWPEVLQTN